MRVVLFGHRGGVGRVLGRALEEAGHAVLAVGRGDEPPLDRADASVDFTDAAAARTNARRSLAAGVPCIVGTTGLGEEDLAGLDAAARDAGVPCLVAANFAVGAVLMMRFAAEAARFLPAVEIVETHHEGKKDAPSGTAKATAARLGADVPIHSLRLPGAVAHQEVVFGGPGQLLTIRHDALSREAFVPGVLLALDRLGGLPPGVTQGIDTLIA